KDCTNKKEVIDCVHTDRWPRGRRQTRGHTMRIAITGAAGHLGRHVIESLLSRGVAAQDLVAIVRTASKAEDLAARGLTVAEAPYEDVAALTEALQGVDRL